MILTNCAACAAPLAHDAPRCVRCKVRYCNRTCQMDHWRRGHKQMCKKIHRGGNAEQYHADKKYKEAVAVAVARCADDTKGQTCYICTEALHWKTKEGLVRGCACRGTAGFVHVSCLAEQAKILYAEAEENNLGKKVQEERFARWRRCRLCEQEHYGVVRGALAWACWKTYVGRPERDMAHIRAMTDLGNGLFLAGHYADALSVREADLATLKRLGAPEHCQLHLKGNIASSYSILGREEDALVVRTDVYNAHVRLLGEENGVTLLSANNCALTLLELRRYAEATSLLLKMMPVARRVLGDSDETTLKMRWSYAEALRKDDGATLGDLRESMETLEDTLRIARRTLGSAHPLTAGLVGELPRSRAALRARETPSTNT